MRSYIVIKIGVVKNGGLRSTLPRKYSPNRGLSKRKTCRGACVGRMCQKVTGASENSKKT